MTGNLQNRLRENRLRSLYGDLDRRADVAFVPDLVHEKMN